MDYKALTRTPRRLSVVPLFLACALAFGLVFFLDQLNLSLLATALLQAGIAFCLLGVAIVITRYQTASKRAWRLRQLPEHQRSQVVEEPPYRGVERRRRSDQSQPIVSPQPLWEE
jgi:hypothetical protein